MTFYVQIINADTKSCREIAHNCSLEEAIESGKGHANHPLSQTFSGTLRIVDDANKVYHESKFIKGFPIH